MFKETALYLLLSIAYNYSDTVRWVAQKVTRNYIDEREKVMRNKFKHIQVSFDYVDNRKDKKTGKHFYNTVMEKQDKGVCVYACVRR